MNDTKEWPWPCKFLVVKGTCADCYVPDKKQCPKRQLRNVISKSCWDNK